MCIAKGIGGERKAPEIAALQAHDGKTHCEGVQGRAQSPRNSSITSLRWKSALRRGTGASTKPPNSSITNSLWRSAQRRGTGGERKAPEIAALQAHYGEVHPKGAVASGKPLQETVELRTCHGDVHCEKAENRMKSAIVKPSACLHKGEISSNERTACCSKSAVGCFVNHRRKCRCFGLW